MEIGQDGGIVVPPELESSVMEILAHGATVTARFIIPPELFPDGVPATIRVVSMNAMEAKA